MLSTSALLFGDHPGLIAALPALLAQAGYAVASRGPADLTDEGTWREAIEEVSSATRPLSLLVHAINLPDIALSEVADPRFEALFAQIIGSLWQGGTLAAERMHENGGGVIIVVVSSAGRLAGVFAEGLRSLAACLGVAYAEAERSVRAIALEGDGKGADALSELIVFLASDDASYLTATAI